MNKKAFIAVSALSLAMTGCLNPMVHSMGATLMPAPLMHTVPADNSKHEFNVTASGFWGHSSEGENIKDLNAGGGSVDVMTRISNKLPFFVNIGVGGFAGSLNFDCNEDGDCNPNNLMDKAYAAWLETDEGKDAYTFWNIQERAILGAEIDAGKVLIFGLGYGVQLFQGDSKYDSMREKLGDMNYVDNVDDEFEIAPVAALWLGGRIGNNGRFGNVVVEYDIFQNGSTDEWTNALKLTYTHSSGFFGSVGSGSLMPLTVSVGKMFTF